MFRLLTAACATCGNTYHVETDDDGSGCVRSCKCPRCYTPANFPVNAGVPQRGSTPWAIRASDPPTAARVTPPDLGRRPPEPLPHPSPPAPGWHREPAG
jgi:hypothetical protein